MNEDVRDRFAAAALTGLLVDERLGNGEGANEDICRKAFEIADAMMKVRKPAKAAGTKQPWEIKEFGGGD